MDAVQKMIESDEEKIPLIVASNKLQEDIFASLCKNFYTQYEISSIKINNDMPYSVNGILALLN